MALVGDGKRTGHARQTAANHQRRLVDRQVELLQGLQHGRSRHRHAGDVLGLLGGGLFFLGMAPGAMLPDIGHVVEILIDARFTKGVPEQRLQGPGAAGRHNHPIEPFFRNRVGDLFDGIGRT